MEIAVVLTGAAGNGSAGITWEQADMVRSDAEFRKHSYIPDIPLIQHGLNPDRPDGLFPFPDAEKDRVFGEKQSMQLFAGQRNGKAGFFNGSKRL